MPSVDIVAAEAASSAVGLSLQRDAFDDWHVATSTFGACNSSGTPPPRRQRPSASAGRTPSDPALPWASRTSSSPRCATRTTCSCPRPSPGPRRPRPSPSIDANGVMTPSPRARRRCAPRPTTESPLRPTRCRRASRSRARPRSMSGTPSSASRPTPIRATTSSSATRSTRLPTTRRAASPNWVSYDLEATHFGPEDRCDCFTFDPALPAVVHALHHRRLHGGGSVPRLRHRSRSPRAVVRPYLREPRQRLHVPLHQHRPPGGGLNQGPWASFENYLGDLRASRARRSTSSPASPGTRAR